jgi:hypothetical protein
VLGRIAPDGEELRMTANGGRWLMARHPPAGQPPEPPPGQPHGANGDLAGQLWMEPGAEPIYARAAHEAGLS